VAITCGSNCLTITTGQLSIRFNPVDYASTSSEVVAYDANLTGAGTLDAKAWVFGLGDNKVYDSTTTATAAGPLRVLYVCAEVFPWLKTGGLADVSAGLPPALAKQGADVRLLLPAFPSIAAGVTPEGPSLLVPAGGGMGLPGGLGPRPGTTPGPTPWLQRWPGSARPSNASTRPIAAGAAPRSSRSSSLRKPPACSDDSPRPPRRAAVAAQQARLTEAELAAATPLLLQQPLRWAWRGASPAWAGRSPPGLPPLDPGRHHQQNLCHIRVLEVQRVGRANLMFALKVQRRRTLDDSAPGAREFGG
jgi:hypothetical protein